MLNSSIPPKFAAVFANSAGTGFIRAIPSTTTDPNAASLALGFPPNTFTDISAGGEPPDGRDFNGLFNQITAWCRWMAAGGSVQYDSAFSSANGGYPKFAVLCSTTPGIFWQSTADNNTTNPDGGSPANWIQVGAAKASAAEVLAGTVDTKFITPFSLATSLGTGNVLTHANGVIEQWGFATGPFGIGTFSVTFPAAFTVADFDSLNIQLTVVDSDASLSDNIIADPRSQSTTGFVFQLRQTTGGTALIDGVSWRAIGR